MKDALRARPDGFEAAQALRLLERLAELDKARLRLRGNTALDCPAGGVQGIILAEDPGGKITSIEATLNHFTLAGANGPLPTPYSEEINARTRSGDTALRDFLDLFLDRLAKLDLARAKLFRPELADLQPEAATLAGPLLALLGMGTAELPVREPKADSLLALAPLMHRAPFSAHAFERAATAWTGLPAQVLPFRGAWIPLDARARTRLGARGGNNRLGEDATLGTAVWDPAAGVTLALGPMPLARARALLPHASENRRLAAFVERLVGAGIEVRLLMRLLPETVPDASLGEGARLGWTSRLRGPAMPAEEPRIVLPAGWTGHPTR